MTFGFIPANNNRLKSAKSREFDSRPCLTVNRLPQFVRQVTNDQRQNRPSIKIRPLTTTPTPKPPRFFKVLCVISKSNSNADQAYDNAPFYAVTGSFGYFRIVTDYASDNSFEQGNLYPPHYKPALCLWGCRL